MGYVHFFQRAAEGAFSIGATAVLIVRAARHERAVERCVRRLLREHGEMSGSELARASNGLLRRPSLYPTMQGLQGRGVVESRVGLADRGTARLYRLRSS